MALVVHRYLPWIAYPGTILLAIVCHQWLLGLQQPLLLSTYLPVFMGLVLVALFELILPNLAAWRPESSEINNDLLFMLFVQVALPRLLGFFALIALVEPMRLAGLTIHGWWPHQSSNATQVILILVVAEFMRYWLHRFAHANPLLWRLHGVHHSVDKLYWLNVGRFHPLEKALQFLFDALPFVLLGVANEVIALYFVFYSINGFFQHSNIHLRHGVLNYLISTAELHRWHHSKLTSEANSNYGNNLIIWDLVFGSWFLPPDRKVTTLGLKNRNYPMSFLAQLGTPFVSDITDKNVPMLSAKQILIKGLLKASMGLARFRYWWPLLNSARSPDEIQLRVLRRILKSNQNTTYGEDKNFTSIDSYQKYKADVPIQGYEDLKPYIDEQIRTGNSAITRQQPLLYAVTSGTTGAPKYLPVTRTSFRHYRSEQRLIVFHQFRACPAALSGRFLGIVSPAIEGYFDSGLPYGSVSGLAYQTMPPLVRANYILPAEVIDIEDYDLKYGLILRLALAERNITYIATANPSSLLRLVEIFHQSPQSYVKDLADGSFHRAGELSSALRLIVEPLLTPNTQRAEELAGLLQQYPGLSYRELWPNLRMVTTWTGGSCGIAINSLKGQLPEQAVIYELGYISSEFRGTLPCSINTAAGVPTLTHHFFEFIEKAAWESGQRETLLLSKLKEGLEYYIIVTTASGLYRYFMNDIVRVRGFLRRTPLLEFVQKGRGVTNITGEKLYESQVRSAIEKTQQAYDFTSPFYLMLADEEQSQYLLL
ncbi:MAG: GH3 auxin-responsive promoter family protein, partial [Flavobacteriales bacterium]|nr:GH3 auxin-responsive promoter family protein [Flavobacteriales bacterium]